VRVFATRILLATDGSAEAARAARMAVGISNELDCELHVLSMGTAPSAYAPAESEILDFEFYQEIRQRAEEEARTRLDEEAQKIGDAGGQVAGTHARVGRPDEEIVRLAEELGVGLVVLGSRGLGPLRRALMGSVSSSVVRHAHCPVLVVRNGEREVEYLPRSILLPFDGSEEADAAARAAVEIASAGHAKMHVLYVLEVERYMPYPGPEAWEWKASLERAKRLARSWVEGQGRRMQTEQAMTIEAHLAFGKPDQEIVRLSEELGADLVVVGSRGLGGLRRALMGSVSDSVVQHARCSVLVVREQAEGRGSA
jgi:nucleotide-binding universal stress UspA family protein